MSELIEKMNEAMATGCGTYMEASHLSEILTYIEYLEANQIPEGHVMDKTQAIEPVAETQPTAAVKDVLTEPERKVEPLGRLLYRCFTLAMLWISIGMFLQFVVQVTNPAWYMLTGFYLYPFMRYIGLIR